MACGKLLKPINTTRTKTTTREDVEVSEPLSPASRLFHAPPLNCCIVAVAGCKIAIDVELVKQGISQTMVKHPRISSKLVFDPKKPGKPVGWIRTKVNVDDHIIIPSLDANIDSPDQFVEDYLSNLTQTPMDLTKPLWEIHILNIKTKDANAIALFRIHHSMGDGTSLMSLVLACTRKCSDPNALPTLPTENKKKKKLFDMPSTSFFVVTLFLWLIFAFKMLWNTIKDFCYCFITMLFLKDTKTHVKGSPGSERTPKRFVYRILSLDDIKLVKNVMDVTINDVLVGITQAGLSRYLNRKYGESKGTGEKLQHNNFPRHIRLRATVLVNIRPTSKLEDLAEQMEADDPKRKWDWGNSIGYILLPFDIAVRDDPLDYIRSAKATIDKKKQSLEAVVTFLSAEIFLKMLGLEVTAFIISRAMSHATLSFSNVVGPKEEISFYGHPMTFLAPSVYGHPQALTVHFQSYMDKMTLVLAVDQNVIHDPHKLCDDIEEFLEHAKQAAQKKKV